MNQCNHTIQALDSAGQPTGSWVIRNVGRGRHVECGVCGKFYGRINTRKHLKNPRSLTKFTCNSKKSQPPKKSGK